MTKRKRAANSTRLRFVIRHSSFVIGHMTSPSGQMKRAKLSDITFRSLEADGADELERFDKRLAVRGFPAEAENTERKRRDIHFHAH